MKIREHVRTKTVVPVQVAYCLTVRSETWMKSKTPPRLFGSVAAVGLAGNHRQRFASA